MITWRETLCGGYSARILSNPIGLEASVERTETGARLRGAAMTPAALAIRVLGGDAARLTRAVIATLRDELGREPDATEIRAVMALLMSWHGELAAMTGRAEERNVSILRITVDVCAVRQAAWLALTDTQRGVLRARDREDGRPPPCDAMRLPCSCGALEHEFCREEAT
jgi:hypothetical protein